MKASDTAIRSMSTLLSKGISSIRQFPTTNSEGKFEYNIRHTMDGKIRQFIHPANSLSDIMNTISRWNEMAKSIKKHTHLYELI